jgi:hypothetical protein
MPDLPLFAFWSLALEHPHLVESWGVLLFFFDLLFTVVRLLQKAFHWVFTRITLEVCEWLLRRLW